MIGDINNPSYVLSSAATMPISGSVSAGAVPFTLPAGTPAINTLTSDDPAANAEITPIVLAKASFIVGAKLQIVQGITQTPLPNLSITDAADVEKVRLPGALNAMAVSTTANFWWSPGAILTALTGSTPNIYGSGPIPDMPALPVGWKIATVTTGKGANTNLGVLTLYVVEYTV